jgi:MoaA/NifB/PqqE/SkfB family radical SAM enzyme
MPRSVFDNAVSAMPESVHTIFFGGMGEPLTHDDIIYMVHRAASQGKRVELLTNGTLLTHETSAALLDAGLRMLWISLDSVSEDGYASIRQNSSLQSVLRNIADFNAERANRNDVDLGLAFVAMRSNLSQLGRLSRFAREHGFSDINISNVLPTDKESLNESLCERIVNLGYGTEGCPPRINLPPMDLRIDGVAGSLAMLRSRRYCKFIGEGAAFVRHDGAVSPCMALLHSGSTFLEGKRRMVYHHSFGNVRHMGLGEIWDSAEYADFRQRVREFDFSPCTQCGGCDFRENNHDDCFGNNKPTCGACLWSEGVLSCP